MNKKFYETWWFITILITGVTAICLAVIIPLISSCMKVQEAEKHQKAVVNQSIEMSTPTKIKPTSTPAPTQAKEQVISLTIPELFAEYDKNKVAADEKFKGKQLFVIGKVAEINKSFLGNPIVDLEGVGMFNSVSCDFSKKYIPEIAKLNKGDVVGVQGECDGIILGIINFSHCKTVK